MATTQTSLFASHHILPKGFDHKDEVLSPDREFVLVGRFAQLPFEEFEFQGFLGRRRVVSFGWRYDFSRRELQKVDEIPDFLLHLRVTATEFAGLDASRFQQVLVTEYSPGAGIGWHKDRPEFEHVIGVSLLSPCLFRLRRKRGNGWERASIELQPRSAYLLSGSARTDWQHSIPPVDKFRYSVTFRSFRR
jgi:alkylated DNA repair dioxygenase AlkB